MIIQRRTWRHRQPAEATPGATRPTASGGFSLIELMLAMTILGLGLVMVATMFPVAWTRARSMAEFTTQENITKSAEVILQQIARVDDDFPSGLAIEKGSFAGTILLYQNNTIPTEVLFEIERNQRVHALYMENITVDAPRRFVPDRVNADAPGSVEFAPWRLERKDDAAELAVPLPSMIPLGFYQSAFGAAQITFEQRVYPPLPRRDFMATDAQGLFTGDDPTWEDEFDERQFAWAILHRFRHEPTDPMAFTAANYRALAAEPRDLDIYYVTLKRSRPTNRYAVQDPDPNKVPNPIAQGMGGSSPKRGELPNEPPAALSAAFDVALPVPWRVQVRFPDTLASENLCDGTADPCNAEWPCPTGVECMLGAGPTGVPTEVEVNWEPDFDAAFVVEMFTPGTPFIDEASGKIYRVARRRLTGENDDKAILTLDREVLLEDIDDGYWTDNPTSVLNQFADLIYDPEERIRTVWVFPPPVERERGQDDVLIFSGNQPVVGIDVRTLTVNP